MKISSCIVFLILCLACKPDSGQPASVGDSTKEAITGKKTQLQKQPAKATLRKEKIDIDIPTPAKVKANNIAKGDTQNATEKKKKSPEKLADPIVKSKKPTAKIKPAVSPAKPKSKPTPKKMPIIEFEELVHDFGELTEGDQISHKFKFKNVGKAPLSITAANATCGCTQPSFPFLDINPGETGIIGVEYFSVNKDGPQEPKITVLGNMEGGSVVLTLKGNVIPNKDKEKKKELQSASVLDTLLPKQ